MSTSQIVIRTTASAFQGVSFALIYERFLGWWVTLYAEAPRKLPPML